MKRFLKLWVVLLLACFPSCTEDFIIDVEEGLPLIGVEASFTDELKHHEAILSYSTNFYHEGPIPMLTGAQVYVTDGVDTIVYHEDATHEGHYRTDLAAGRKNTLYRFCAVWHDPDSAASRIFAESMMPNNAERIDSIVIKHFNGGNDSVPTVFVNDTIEWLYPYFQSLPDPSIIYMAVVYLNDSLVSDTLTKRMVIPIGGYAGYYINGPEMQAANKEIPIGFFRRSELHEGDRIKVILYSISADDLYFFYSLMMSTGSNPMMGAPANVSTNIQPEGKGVGWFSTASAVAAETIFRK